MSRLYRFSFLHLLFIYYVYIYLLFTIFGGSRCHPCYTVYVEVRRQPAEVWSLFLSFGFRDQIQILAWQWISLQADQSCWPFFFFSSFLNLVYSIWEAGLFFRFFFFSSLFSLYISSYYATLCLDHKTLGFGISLIHLESIRNERNGRRLRSWVLEPHF